MSTDRSIGDRRDIRGLIRTKRAGGELGAGEIDGLIADLQRTDRAQLAALLMAGVVNGFSRAEAVALTHALVASGTVLDLSGLTVPTVDKHSTGGVGDTTTLVVGPILAACGLGVAKLSGRALGHTGGTIDKLEAIPGMRHDLDARTIRAQVERIGLAVASATRDLAPADATLYALRNETATVDDVALIAASVMSKKLAGGASTVVLDVKTGGGAFLTDPDRSRELAHLCVEIGADARRAVGALITDMSQPLGPAVGNALEVCAAVDVLRGRARGRLGELSVALSAAALRLAGRGVDDAQRDAAAALGSGAALERFREFVAAQGGDPAVAETPREVVDRAPHVRTWEPPPGTVQAIDARGIGELAHDLGTGAAVGAADAAVGLEVLVGIGDDVGPGAAAARVHARSIEDADRAAQRLDELIVVGSEPMDPPPLVVDRVEPATAASDGS